MSKVAMAVGAHPDDIEIMMGGTFLLLGSQGYELHYMTLADGSCGSTTLPPEKIAALRIEESRAAARLAGAVYHEPLVHDLEIFYEPPLIRKLCAAVREIEPRILLLPSPVDYMEDHNNTSRLMVTAAFCRNMPNFATDPPADPVDYELAVYHAPPYGLVDQLRKPVIPQIFVDIASVLPRKRDFLACHKSQKEWLDESQGVDNYLDSMERMSAEVGAKSRRFQYAEGWFRHSHLGFGDEGFDPLTRDLSAYCMEEQWQERSAK